MVDELIENYPGCGSDTVAYSSERLFQIESNIPVQFESEDDMMVYIWSNYNYFKPLEIDMRYPWCANLYKLVENESLFQDCFFIKNSKFGFLDSVSEEDRRKAREKAYQNYNPQKCT